MGDSSSIMQPSAKLKKAICWISEMVQEHPDFNRKDVLRQAEIRFDLTPRECEFLNTKFDKVTSGNPC